jgi:preprotein translocase subunit SecA
LIGTKTVKESMKLSSLLESAHLNFELLNAFEHEKEASIIARAGKKGSITIATNMAGRGTDIKVDDEVNALGGLCVIAAEKNFSKRIDRQLYGRAGRQGQNGAVLSHISLEEELFLRFLPKSVHRVLNLVVKHAPGISSRFLSLAVLFCQRRNDRMNAKMRKNLLKSDHSLRENLGV